MSDFSELNVFRELNEFAKNYAIAKKEGNEDEISKTYQEMLLRFMAIKKLNTSLAERLQKSRKQHENAKENADRLKLKSANLEYKREHLLRDIHTCGHCIRHL